MNNFQEPSQHATTSDNGPHRPIVSDTEGQRPTLSEADKAKKNLTVKEVEKLLAVAGFPRDERSIQRYCKQGSLDGELHPDDHEYYISLASVEKLIKKFQDAQSRRAFGPFADSGPAVSDGIRHAAPLPRQEPDARQPEAEHPRLQALENEVTTLKREKKELEEKHFTVSYEKKASEQMVTMLRDQLKEDRKEFFQQMDKLMKEVGETKQLVGRLETQLKQIAAPTSHTPSVTRPITEAEVIDATSTTTSDTTPPTSASATHAAFADIREPHAEERV